MTVALITMVATLLIANC